MLSFPLTRPNRIRLAQAFALVPRVDIGIDCVLEDQMGQAFVDSLDNPQYFMIEMDGFFCYFAGDFRAEAGRAFLSQIPRGRMLMAGSDGWQDIVESCFGDALIKIQRHNYSSEGLSLEKLKAMAEKSPHASNIKRVDLALAASYPPFLEYGAFDSPEDFVERGIGYCMMNDGAVIGAAYSSLVANRQIEVSVVVEPQHYRKGIASALCANLLYACVEKGVAPHWDAANEESCLLAEKLGYHKIESYKAYFLKAQS